MPEAGENPQAKIGFYADVDKDQYEVEPGMLKVEEIAQTSYDYRSHCEEQIYPGFATIPPEYKHGSPDRSFYSGVTHPQPLTELSAINHRVRRRIALAITKCIKDNREFAVIFSDATQLKRLNDVAGRSVGDLGILNNAVEMIKAITEAGLGDKIDVFGASEAADEVIILARDLDQEDLKKLKLAVQKRNEVVHKVVDLPKPGSDKPVTATFMGAAGMATSRDEEFKEELAKFRGLIEGRLGAGERLPPAFELYDEMFKSADEKSHEVKEKLDRKVLSELDLQVLQLPELTSLMVEANGGGRLSQSKLQSIIEQAQLNVLYQMSAMTDEELEKEKKNLIERLRDYIEGR